MSDHVHAPVLQNHRSGQSCLVKIQNDGQAAFFSLDRRNIVSNFRIGRTFDSQSLFEENIFKNLSQRIRQS
jgi:hypothetical protein